MNFLDFQDKVCVVTGAASGMGRALAEYLVELGARVFTLDYAEVDLAGIEEKFEVNLANKEEIDEVFAQLPEKFDHFFGVAGVSGQQHDHNTLMKINFLANKYIIEEYLLDRMESNGAVSIVSSVSALWWEKYIDETQPLIDVKGWDATLDKITELNLDEVHGNSVYVFTKRLANHLVSEYAPNFMEKNVRINATMPAVTRTGMFDEFTDMLGGEENLITGCTDRPATSEEMAQPLLFLHSSMSSYITGTCLLVDAGDGSQQMLNKKPKDFDFPIFG